MKTTHYVTIGMLLGALALLVAGLHSWREATSPQFVSGVLLATSTVLKATFDDRPQGKE
jgi:hypothetical protein